MDKHVFKMHHDVGSKTRLAVYELLKNHFGDKPKIYGEKLKTYHLTAVYFNSYDSDRLSWITVLQSFSDLAKTCGVPLASQGEIDKIVSAATTIEKEFARICADGYSRMDNCLELWSADFGTDFQKRISAIEIINQMIEYGDDMPLEGLKKLLQIATARR